MTVHARRGLGQNFLIDPNLQKRIVDALELAADDAVLEIGPGTGALTRHIAGRVRRFTAVEKDTVLAAQLQQQFGGTDGVTILHGDALEFELCDAGAPETLKVVGNIPYNITTPLLFHLLERDHRPERIVVMVQREVADRILAAAASRDYGALTVGIRAVADVERVLRVGRDAFRPRPTVDSAVLRITPRRPPPLDPQEEQDLRSLTRAVFAWRRKQLGRTLRSAPRYTLDDATLHEVLQAIGVRPHARAETLDPDSFITLARVLREHGFPANRNE